MNYKDFTELILFLERTKYLFNLEKFNFKEIQMTLKNIEEAHYRFFFFDNKPNPQLIRFYRNMFHPSAMSYYYRFFHVLFAWLKFWLNKLSLIDCFLLAITELYDEFSLKVAIDEKFKHFAFLFYLAYLKIQEKIPQAFDFLKDIDIFPEIYTEAYKDFVEKYFDYIGEEIIEL